MARALTIGNGSMLVGIDGRGQVRDLYFPFAGHANHVSGASGSYTHRVGVWVDGTLRWLTHNSWRISFVTSDDGTTHTLVGENDEIGVTVRIHDGVHNEQNIFIRHVELINTKKEERTIKIFFAQEFRIAESRRGDTAFFDPRVHAIIHYKGRTVFLMTASCAGVPFDDYTVGLFGIEHRDGSYIDAEDGVLSKNAIEHGSVDSVIGLTSVYAGEEKKSVYYTVTASHSVEGAHNLKELIDDETPARLLSSSDAYWHAWVKKERVDFSPVGRAHERLYIESLRIMRVHTDNGGGIIASSDTDILNQGRDTYGYVWPRDASITAHALTRAGYHDRAEKYFTFLSKLIMPKGYLMHKYRVDGVLGSSWHPWVRDGVPALPIQEDETALPLFILSDFYAETKNLEFIESLYNPFVEPAADFLSTYINHESGLPLPSYDLWEEKYGSSTYTAASVYGGLMSAAQLSALLGKRAHAKKYRDRAEEVKHAIVTHLYNPHTRTFLKLVRTEGNTQVPDQVIDASSFHGLTYFGVLDAHDARVVHMEEAIRARLSVPHIGGIMRYEGDGYYRTSPTTTPNPWCITTLWLAQYYIRRARTRVDLKTAYELLQWVVARAHQTGILPEQIHPESGEHLSVSPLVWSHAEYVLTLDAYIKKWRSLK